MDNLLKAYQDKYGIAEKYILADFGGNIMDIITEYQNTPPWPFASMLQCDFSDADNIHNLVLRDIQSRYFQQITRDQAVTICNVLFKGCNDGTIKISNRLELEYNAVSFMATWNENHSGEDKISPPTTFEI